ncbi:hypothetical protein C9374_014164 [Naegleria lovaniensis]|uniref:Fatty acid hydroxylase domain-containing protein n=1 Tax=Naegleria lovaniensis TaxID=51637 RepID=A0AA88KPX3_NAELO|nr:uncharacterized protein C9374_014164 [Naegleria lovaniensis]KAG2389604.1 hypothetical protein C9374_014164 [Naegleria lovaniensis]
MNQLLHQVHNGIKEAGFFLDNYIAVNKNISTIYPEDKLAEMNVFDAGLVKLWKFMLENYSLNMVTIVLPFTVLFLNYFFVCGFMFLIEQADFSFLRKYKIQAKKYNSASKVFWASLYLLYVYFVIILPMYTAAFYVLSQVDYFSLDLLDIPNWKTLAWQTLAFLFFEDLGHYVLHRWMHTPWAYKTIHYKHHEFDAPSSLATSYAHPVEVVIQGIATFLGPVIVRPHILTLFIWVNIRQLAACETHSGYDFPFSPNNILPFCGGADLHDFHHRTYNGAYSSNFIWWDVLLGTDNGYFAWKKKQQAKRARGEAINVDDSEDNQQTKKTK